ncbi:MAG: type II toxin-antitoxin system VapC family toxin [Candidatus Methylumidiphilus sp.]
MKPGVFVDTSAWYALIDRADPDHMAVSACMRQHKGALITSNFIFDETVTLLRYRLGWQPAHRFGELLRAGGLAQCVAIEAEDEAVAWSIFVKYNDHELSFTDCSSFALMRRLKLSTAIALDADFHIFGLLTLPALRLASL